MEKNNQTVGAEMINTVSSKTIIRGGMDTNALEVSPNIVR